MSQTVDPVVETNSQDQQRCKVCKPEDDRDEIMPWWPRSHMGRHLTSKKHIEAARVAMIRAKSTGTATHPPVPSIPPDTIHDPFAATWIYNSHQSCNTSTTPFGATYSSNMPPEEYSNLNDPVMSASDAIFLDRDPRLQATEDGLNFCFQYGEALDDPISTFDRETEPEALSNENEDDNSASEDQCNPATDPWPDMKHFYTHLLFRSLRLGLSSQQKEAILWWAKVCGMQGVPTTYSLDKCEKKLQACGEDPIHTSKTYYKAFSNPSIRHSMMLYPTDGEGVVAEVWDAEKLAKGEHRDQLTPMAVSPNNHTTHYYINELCELEDGDVFIPKMFLRRDDGLWARGCLTTCSTDVQNAQIIISVHSNEVLRPLAQFRRNCLQLMDRYAGMLKFEAASSYYQTYMPHPLRRQADGREVYSVPLIVFQDDVSANRTKQWNKHHVVYASNAALPREELNRASNVKFVCSSPHAQPLEMMGCVMQMCEETFEAPIVVWDAATEREVLLRMYALCISADNQMHVEHCSSTGMQSNLFCRMCMSGGPQAFRATLDGFSGLFKPGKPRELQDTINHLEAQWTMVLDGHATSHLDATQRDSGIKDPIAQPWLDSLLARRNEMTPSKSTNISKDMQAQIASILKQEYQANTPALRMNPLLQMKDFDVHKDTPIEILHTVQLGAVKYYWRFTCKHLNKEQFNIFKTRFESLPVAGLDMGTSRVPEYICRYPGSCIGTHFRFIIQLIPFALRGLVPPELFRVWLVLGRLTVLLWHKRILNMDEYCNELTTFIDDFLHAVSTFDPMTITTKAKLHILTHAPFHVRRFGPLLGPDSERYEAFNSNFRLLSVLSTRLAPSHDAAQAFSRIDRLTHVASGGWWYNAKYGRYMQAGPAVLHHMRHDSKSRELLNLDAKELPDPGSVCFKDGERTLSSHKPWAEILANLVPCPSTVPESTHFDSATQMIAENGNKVEIGSDIILCNPLEQENSINRFAIGRVVHIVMSTDSKHSLLVYNPFAWRSEVDRELCMPALIRQERHEVAICAHVKCVINLQHHCAESVCDESGSKTVRQERELTTITRPISNHGDSTNYILNLNSMTNYEYIHGIARAHSMLPSRLLNADEYLSIRQSAIARLNEIATQRAEKREHNRLLKKAAEQVQAQREATTAPESASNDPTMADRAASTSNGGGQAGGQTRSRGRGLGRGLGRGRGRGRGRGGILAAASPPGVEENIGSFGNTYKRTRQSTSYDANDTTLNNLAGPSSHSAPTGNTQASTSSASTVQQAAVLQADSNRLHRYWSEEAQRYYIWDTLTNSSFWEPPQ
ncbi:hypothetical protein FRC09_007147 [Ceratobasidium sp. 395]|nr:hypothetical protein FRC09_007147 [Ceratobasidium sp. 395]